MARVNLLTVPETALRYRCSVPTLLRRVRRGEVPHRKLSARQIVFIESEIEAHILLRAAGAPGKGWQK